MWRYAELKRRNVFRVAAAYVVVGWLVTEVASTILPLFETPAWVIRSLVVLIALGFFPALVVSWVYELTPEGLKRQEEVDSMQSIAAQTGRRLDYITIVAILAGVAFITLSPRVFNVQQTVDPGVASTASVAVLPFVNISGKPENEYFSDGLTETMLHMLAQTPQLQVAARTSSFSFKGTNADIREIAAVLGVAHVLEGSVQRDGERIRITAQLIRADDGFHVWSESYDRKLENVFAIQDEIATRVNNELLNTLLERGIDVRGVETENVEAYDLYLRALPLQAQWSWESLTESERLLKSALNIDPQFVEAQVELARNYVMQVIAGHAAIEQVAPDALALLEEALRRKPGDPASRALMLNFEFKLARQRGTVIDVRAIHDEFEQLIRRAPQDTDTTLRLHFASADLGVPTELFMPRLQRAARLDPLNSEVHFHLAYAHFWLDDYESSLASAGRALELESDLPFVHKLRATIHRKQGNVGEWIDAEFDALRSDPENIGQVADIAMHLYRLGLVSAGDEFRDRLIAIAPASPLAQLLELNRAWGAGDADLARRIAYRLIEDGANASNSVWLNALTIALGTATSVSEMSETLAHVEAHVDGLLDAAQPQSNTVLSARAALIPVLLMVKDEQEISSLIASLSDYFAYPENEADQLFTVYRLIARDDHAAATDYMLDEVLQFHGLYYRLFDGVIELPVFDTIRSDDRVAVALERRRRELIAAAATVEDYLAKSGN